MYAFIISIINGRLRFGHLRAHKGIVVGYLTTLVLQISYERSGFWQTFSFFEIANNSLERMSQLKCD